MRIRNQLAPPSASLWLSPTPDLQTDKREPILVFQWRSPVCCGYLKFRSTPTRKFAARASGGSACEILYSFLGPQVAASQSHSGARSADDVLRRSSIPRSTGQTVRIGFAMFR